MVQEMCNAFKHDEVSEIFDDLLSVNCGIWCSYFSKAFPDTI